MNNTNPQHNHNQQYPAGNSTPGTGQNYPQYNRNFPGQNPGNTPAGNFTSSPTGMNRTNYPYPPQPQINPQFQQGKTGAEKGQTPDPAQGKKASANKKQPSIPFGELFSRFFVGALTLFIVVYMGWLYAPRIRNAMTFWPTVTPTPVTPTPTIPATMTVTPLATNTPTASPTPTPGPISTYWIANGNVLDPPVPNAPEGLVILSAKNSAEVDPALDSIYWTSSSQIVQDLGRLTSSYDSEWFATINNGWIRYYMDQPLKEGLYELYVMDTFYSSGGTLDFLVQVGSQSLSPMTGSQSVTFMTSQYDPRQNYDTWRSLGIYYITQSRDVLTVSTSWGFRDEYSYVAADRVMIVPRKNTDLGLLNSLPTFGTRYIMDDTQAAINAGNSSFKESRSTSWDDSYQLIINPKTKSTVEYNSLEPWPIGAYSIYLYIPESKGNLDAEIQVRTDNTLLETVSGEETVHMHIPPTGGWVLVGQYNTDRYYERPVKFKVNITIPEGQTG
ncbi:MAG: hypothetical protein IKP86_10695, partial [Anaerolineaceae bacterium]|nr:hypothetical protein [Anaerolineaceae bacterium]